MIRVLVLCLVVEWVLGQDVWQYQKEYKAGDKVKGRSKDKVYICKRWPFTGWCGIYDPEGVWGKQAWSLQSGDQQSQYQDIQLKGNHKTNHKLSQDVQRFNRTADNQSQTNSNQSQTNSNQSQADSNQSQADSNQSQADSNQNQSSSNQNSADQNGQQGNQYQQKGKQQCGKCKQKSKSKQKVTLKNAYKLYQFKDWVLKKQGIKVKRGKVIILNKKIKRILYSARVYGKEPAVDLEKIENNVENVQRVMKILSKQQFEYLFPVRNKIYRYEQLLKGVRKFPSICSERGKEDDDLDEICKLELSTIFAHIVQETGGNAPENYYKQTGVRNVTENIEKWRQGLFYVNEMGCNNKKNGGCLYSSTCDSPYWQNFYKCYQNQKYYGRGAKQLSYPYNYGLFSRAMFGDPKILLKDPSLVSRQGWLAISSAFWFYVTPQSPKPSMHDVVVGHFKPNSYDLKSNIEDGFGTTINIINGGIECGHNSVQARNRVNYFLQFVKYLKLDPKYVDRSKLDCKNQNRFDNRGAGSILLYWDKDWKQGRCKIVRWQTGFLFIYPQDYIRCVNFYYGDKTVL